MSDVVMSTSSWSAMWACDERAEGRVKGGLGGDGWLLKRSGGGSAFAVVTLIVAYGKR